MQLDMGYRGFSFLRDGPLDMRMGPNCEFTAEDIINSWSEKDLGELFRDCGEERKWRQAAAAIVQARRKNPIRTTKQLADLIVDTFKTPSFVKLHPATLIFQALRICVNCELESVQIALKKAIGKLSHGGRMGVISFHSLEDRIVKNVFKSASAPPTKQDKIEGKFFEPLLRLLTKKPLCPSFAEIKLNPRSRSAKLRFAERT
jgi:16S rRNA (cytosine1402-N4)-methyltransferase